ncbi:MAG: hypothetical protein KJ697_00110 [Nanoarchaeota archaeon]|nr:hypothetical protein [Nanoarchaeota archaeon]
MAARKRTVKAQATNSCNCVGMSHHHCGFMPILLGIAMLLAVFLRYMGYSYKMIVAVFGVLLILKGIMKMTMHK